MGNSLQDLVKFRKAQVDDLLRQDESARGRLHTCANDNTIFVCGWVADRRYTTGVRHEVFWVLPIDKQRNWDVQWRFLCRYLEGNLPGFKPINFSKLEYMPVI